MSADAVIEALGLSKHPEGGWYAEYYRGPEVGGRAVSTAIYFLLERGERSHWHRVLDADEIWHHYAGAPLLLEVASGDGIDAMRDGMPDDIHGTGDGITRHRIGSDVLAGERPWAIVPAGVWQAARSLGEWTLVGCTVAPGFEFSSFELAPPGFVPRP